MSKEFRVWSIEFGGKSIELRVESKEEKTKSKNNQ
jgi:hypothetical protein